MSEVSDHNILFQMTWVNAWSSKLYMLDSNNDDAYFQSKEFSWLLHMCGCNFFSLYIILFFYIYYFRMLYSFIFIWQTTLSKRHLDQKFHGMFVSLHDLRSVVLYPFGHKFSKLCINHRGGVRAKPFCTPLPALHACV